MITDRLIAVDDPRNGDVRALLQRHLAFALSTTPPEHAFALDVDGLLDPAVTFYSLRASGELLGVGAIKQLDARHGEIKSMHTAQGARGRGVGRAMLGHLLGVARSRGYLRVSLETGTMAGFAGPGAVRERGVHRLRSVRRLPADEDNCFMTLPLGATAREPAAKDRVPRCFNPARDCLAQSR